MSSLRWVTRKMNADQSINDSGSCTVIKSLRKYVIGSTIRQPKTVQCIKGHGDIISGQYKSVYTKEDQESLVPDSWPDSEPEPRMETFYIVNEKGIENLLRSSNPQMGPGPDIIPAQLFKKCAEQITPTLATIFN